MKAVYSDLLGITLPSCFLLSILLTSTASMAEERSDKSGVVRPASESLSQKVEQTLANNLRNRMLSKERNAAWQVVHGAVGYGDKLPLEVDGKSVPAVEYLLGGGTIDGWKISLGPVLPTTKRTGIIAEVEPGSFIGQGHTDQWLAYFSQVPIPLERTVVVDGKSLQLIDWARQAQWDVPTNNTLEYSWTLIALTNYFPNESQWQGNDGNTWDLESLVSFEAQQDLSDSACGGMHRLMGLAHAVRFRQRSNGAMNGGWLKAKSVVDQCIEAARKFQNSDGSFSTNYSARGGTSGNLSVSISATGHTLEFLAYALDANELENPWMEKAVSRLCDMLKASESIDLECGGVYHAIAGLRLYQSRRFSSKDENSPSK